MGRLLRHGFEPLVGLHEASDLVALRGVLGRNVGERELVGDHRKVNLPEAELVLHPLVTGEGTGLEVFGVVVEALLVLEAPAVGVIGADLHRQELSAAHGRFSREQASEC